MAKKSELPISLDDARKLLTAVEMQVVEQSHRARDLTADTLKDLARRSRRLRDKFRGLAAKQRRVGRGKQESTRRRASTADGNERTHMKADLFDTLLSRFEGLLSSGAALIATENSDRKPARAKPSRRGGSAAAPPRKRKRAELAAEAASRSVAGVRRGSGAASESGDSPRSSKKRATAKAASQGSGAKSSKKAGKKSGKKAATKRAGRK